MTRERGRARRLAVLWLLLLLGGNAWALTDEEIFRDFLFNFINPGARALSLGGAYIAAAEDATAAEANPAALHYVQRKEFFAEYRTTETARKLFRPTTDFGSNAVDSTESFTDFTTVTTFEDANLLTFASFAYPFRIGTRRATLAASRQVVLSAETSLSDVQQGLDTSLDVSLVDFPVVVNPGPPPFTERYAIRNEVDGFLDAELIHYNLAFSFSLTEHFSLGVTGTLAELDMQSAVDSVTSDPEGILVSENPRVGPEGAREDIRFQTAIDDSDSAFGYAVGLHWHPDRAFPDRARAPIRLGLVYRKGAELEVPETTQRSGFEVEEAPSTLTNVLKVPDRFGVGGSYETPKHWLFALDLERIQYSDLLEDYVTGVNFFTGDIIPESLISVNPDDLVFDVDDATVVHAGVEYFFTSKGQWNHAVRVGYFNAPDNRIRLDEIAPNPDRDPTIDAILLDLFREGEDVDHLTVGFSVNVPLHVKKPPHVSFELQFAANLSDAGDEYLASTIWRFGRIQR
jgi:long-subunit fatty acid transport protein